MVLGLGLDWTDASEVDFRGQGSAHIFSEVEVDDLPVRCLGFQRTDVSEPEVDFRREDVSFFP